MDNSVYLGVWTNWSRGPVLGLTLTTTRERGNLLLVLTAFFISFVATRLWKIFCLALHRSYSTSEPRDTVHHQQQVILRNSSSPESGILSLLRLIIAYRSSLKGRLIRRLTPVLLAILLLTGFTVAGGYSSSISSSIGDEALARSDNCALIDSSTTISSFNLWAAYSSKRIADATQYAQHCYTNASAGMPECQKYVVDKIATNITNTSAPCPFEEQVCQTKENILLDTGYIDSHESLGINAQGGERFAFRYVLHCAPLKTNGYTTTISLDNGTWAAYHYGTSKSGTSDNRTVRPFTYAARDIREQYDITGYDHLQEKRYLLGQVLFCTIHSLTRIAYAATSAVGSVTIDGKPHPDYEIMPISELTRSDGDVAIVFLVGNGVQFLERTDDAWYRATAKSAFIGNGQTTGETQTYRPTEAASPMGCVQQWQWCNLAYPKDVGCGPLASQNDAVEGAAPLFNLTSQDLGATWENGSTPVGTRLTWPLRVTLLSGSHIVYLLNNLGGKALTSQDRFYSGVQFPIPNNQWQQDVTFWWKTALSLIQAAFVETVYASTDTQLDPLRRPPLNEEDEKMCRSQARAPAMNKRSVWLT
ncbi:hypothetical protein NUW58_g8076 [Xylaria curta]|uniref:Uncharacterized protein n=1 Tax=Xylaria curta TaxID=42375 RepID=A0ACC1NB34_9PEZI|nr:hypothetical protein NUW58_g8076 [Xylaria curta]